MSKGGPPEGVTYQDAYRFEVRNASPPIVGTVFKILPRRISWEARIDRTSIRAVGETRGDAVAEAIRQASAR